MCSYTHNGHGWLCVQSSDWLKLRDKMANRNKQYTVAMAWSTNWYSKLTSFVWLFAQHLQLSKSVCGKLQEEYETLDLRTNVPYTGSDLLVSNSVRPNVLLTRFIAENVGVLSLHEWLPMWCYLVVFVKGKINSVVTYVPTKLHYVYSIYSLSSVLIPLHNALFATFMFTCRKWYLAPDKHNMTSCAHRVTLPSQITWGHRSGRLDSGA